MFFYSQKYQQNQQEICWKCAQLLRPDDICLPLTFLLLKWHKIVPMILLQSYMIWVDFGPDNEHYLVWRLNLLSKWKQASKSCLKCQKIAVMVPAGEHDWQKRYISLNYNKSFPKINNIQKPWGQINWEQKKTDLGSNYILFSYSLRCV